MSGDTRRRSWTAITDGVRIVLHGDMRVVATFDEARALAGAVRTAVLAVVPEARFVFNVTPETCQLLATVNADDLAVSNQGPVHRKAIGRIRGASNRAVDAAGWLESEKLVQS